MSISQKKRHDLNVVSALSAREANRRMLESRGGRG